MSPADLAMPGGWRVDSAAMAGRSGTTNVPTEATLRELASFDAGDAAVLSFYLDTDGSRFPRRADYEKTTSDLLRTVDVSQLPRQARAGIEADMHRISEFVTKDLERSGVRGVAIFACGPRKLWQVFTLPVPVRGRAVVDRHPHVLRLEAMLTRAERFCTVLVSRDRARLFTTHLGQTTERTEVLDSVPGKHGQGGLSQANYSRHIDELAQRHYKHVADELFTLSKREPFDHLILAGPDEALATFEKSLHAWLTERVAGRVSLPMAASAKEVHAATVKAEDVLETERAADSVTRVLEEFAAGRHGVVGVDPTLAALLEGRVEVLAITDGEPLSGFRCTSCGRLAVADGDCPVCAASMAPVADLHEEMVDEALRRRCRVVAAETRPLPGGVGALLRF